MDIKKLVAAIASAHKAHGDAVAEANAARKAALDPLHEKLAAAVAAKGLKRPAMREIVYTIFAKVYEESIGIAARGPLAGKLAFENTNCAARRKADRTLDQLFDVWVIDFSFSEKEIAMMDALVKGVLKLKAKNADGEEKPVGRDALKKLLNERYDAAEGK